MDPVVLAPGFISTEGSRESLGTFSPDGLEFYFTRSIGLSATDHTAIMVTRLEGERWTLPTKVPFSQGPYDFEPKISPDGSRLYYTRSHDTDPDWDLVRGPTERWIVE